MKGLLKFITCGSVDDGKSTLIGHILYDSKLIYADQEKALTLDSRVGSRGGAIDYSLLLDGLMAEREQGITIDVAYRYFTTEKRSFIVADTPGHEEYTRNMAVGASFAELAVLLVDASQGVLTQTRRHARICKLMGIEHYVFAINKMDLVGYSETVFNEISKTLESLAKELELGEYVIIPVSATEGDNVTIKSSSMEWYSGKTILDHLETVDTEAKDAEEGFYMPVQRVCRPSYSFRGFQGQIESGSIRVGDGVLVLPSGEEANVKGILTGCKEAEAATLGQAVTITLDKEVDISRGCVIVKDTTLDLASEIEVSILWMNDEALNIGHNFLVKIGTRLIPGTVSEIEYLIDINSGERKDAEALSKNALAVCKLKLADVVVVDRFSNHKTLGELILIDRITNMTSACGVITDVIKSGKDDIRRVTRDVRAQLNMQKALIFEFRLNHGEGYAEEVALEAIHKVERELVFNQRHTYLYHPSKGEPAAEVLSHLVRAGIVVLFVREEGLDISGIESLISPDVYISDWQRAVGGNVSDIADFIYQQTRISNVYQDGESI